MKYSQSIKRKLTKKIKLGNVEIGGDAPISVQTMTNTITHNEVGISRRSSVGRAVDL